MVKAVQLLAAAPTARFYLRDQEPLRSEWDRKFRPGTVIQYARGKHKGWDLQSHGDRDIFAVMPGTIRHVDFGRALGMWQFVLRASDGSGWFYAHCASRPANGAQVKAGQRIATMGNSGTTAIHLHLELLSDWNDWYSSTYTSALHELWEALQPMTKEQMAELKAYIDASGRKWAYSGAREVIRALATGADINEGAIPDDDPAWDRTLKCNLRAILEKLN